MTLKHCLSQYLDADTTATHSTRKTFPFFTSGDRWETLTSSGWDDWVAGFWPGIHWIAADAGSFSKDRALEVTRQIEPIYERNINVGFRYQYSWVPAYEATGKSKYKRKALKAAERLSRCYYPDLELIGNPDTGVGRRDNNTIKVANDALMNLPLLLWAINCAPESGEYRSYLEKYLTKATQLFVKPNGAVRHRIHYNREDCSIDRVDSPQGIAGGCWSRGLAWTVYGLTLSGIFLNNDRFIDTAKAAMNYHQENSYNLIPAFDYSISTLNKPSLTDTSAAAILASAMLTLGKLRNNAKADKLGRRITKRLFDRYRRNDDQDGLIDGGCFHYHEGDGVNEATIWGDFYALEARYIMEHNELPTHLNWIQATPYSRAKAS